MLKLISESRRKITDEETREKLLRITERLLREKNMPADGTFLPLTALMDASQNDDKPFAHLLLRYGANPYKRRGDRTYENNALEMEKGEPKGWLKQMVIINTAEKEGSILKYWLLKNYISNKNDVLLAELEQLILNDFITITFEHIEQNTCVKK